MQKKGVLKFVLFILIAVALLCVDLLGGVNNPLSVQNINQGLDLQGGVSILYEADVENPSAEDMSAAVSLMQSRLDSAGYTEAEVSAIGDNRIQVDIPGVTDSEEAIETIGATAQLLFLDEDGNVLLTGDEVEDAQQVVNGQTGNVEIELEFTDEGADLFAQATADNIGKSIIIVLDDQVLSAATVQSEITGGNAVITGDFTAQEAQQTASLIRSGSLPFGLNTISIENKGAKLGAEALNTSILAGFIGIALILLFMLVTYRTFGLVADIALLIYVGLLLLFVNLFNITLTLPGIAGIILTVGMAVDANIIIFERIKEEMYEGKTLRYSVKSGFSRAFPAIVDGNITTLIAGIVLLVLGTGTVKGFAQTLTLGIIISMFTALVVTKIILNSLIEMGLTNKKLYGIKEKEAK